MTLWGSVHRVCDLGGRVQGSCGAGDIGQSCPLKHLVNHICHGFPWGEGSMMTT